MSAQASGLAQFAPRLQAGVQLGDYVLGQPLWPLRIADVYRANGPKGPAAVFVIHAPVAADAAVRDAIIAGTRAAAALPEHKHLVRTLAAGLTGDILWIATEEIDGSNARDMLIKKKQAGTAGFGARGTGNLVSGVTGGLAEVVHGALAAESVIVSRTGRVRIVDLALGAGTLAAMQAGLVPVQSSVAPGAPEDRRRDARPATSTRSARCSTSASSARRSSAAARGRARSCPARTQQIDEVVARACHRDPDKRFGRVDVIGEVIAEALGKGGAMETSAVPTLARAPDLDKQAQSLADRARDRAGRPGRVGQPRRRPRARRARSPTPTRSG